MECPEVWARMAILNKQLKTAEAVFLEQNMLEKALDMYKQLHKWDEGIIIYSCVFPVMESRSLYSHFLFFFVSSIFGRI